MADKYLIRDFEFEERFFSEESPWRDYVGDDESGKAVETLPESELQCYAVSEILRLADPHSLCMGVIKGELTPGDLEERLRRFDDGGSLQHIALNFNLFAFPIFEAKPLSEDGTTEVFLEQYSGLEGYITSTIEAHRVGGKLQVPGLPVPKTKVRASDPMGPNSDGRIILFERERSLEFDFWQASVKDESGTIHQEAGFEGKEIALTGSVARFDTGPDGLGAQIPQPTIRNSARASGLPYLGGLFIPEDLSRMKSETAFGVDPARLAIDHALAFTLPQSRFLQNRFASPNHPPDYVYPASDHERSAGSCNPYALASGQRIRLKDSIFGVDGQQIDELNLRPITRIFLNTLRDYGAYLVDGGLAFAFAAEDVWTAPLDVTPEAVHWLVRGFEPEEETTPWGRVMRALQKELYTIPFSAPALDKSVAERFIFNFEVVANPGAPSKWIS